MRGFVVLFVFTVASITYVNSVGAASHKCHPYINYPDATKAVTSQWTVPSLCQAYKFPTKLTAAGVVGILELDGGWVQSDLDAFSQLYGMPKFVVNDVSVDGGRNSPGQDVDADAEVTLDIECAAAAYFYATGTVPTINVYFAPNSTASFVNTINAAVADKCDVLSISWGNDEKTWQAQSPGSAAQVEAAAQAATAAGMIIFAAAGDSSSSDGDTGTNVDLPGSCPHVISCGGTTKTVSSETVWGDGVAGDNGTGGGFSALFPVQSFQVGAPTAPSGLGRMVPDIAADADPNTGLIFVVDGSEMLIGGTSVVAPLYAGLFAALGKKLGFVTPTLWSNHTAFVDITSGSNGAYSAAVGPDPCSGLGVPNGQAIAALFGKTTTTTNPTPTPTTPNVTVTLSAGTLTIQGDNNSDKLSVLMNTRSHMLEVEGLGTTTINGTTSYKVAATGNIALNVTLGSGNDEIAFYGISTAKVTSTMNLGAGNDKAAFVYCEMGTLDIDGGAGSNVLFSIASRFSTLNATDFINVPHREPNRSRYVRDRRRR